MRAFRFRPGSLVCACLVYDCRLWGSTFFAKQGPQQGIIANKLYIVAISSLKPEGGNYS